jgi:hypothetical protein
VNSRRDGGNHAVIGGIQLPGIILSLQKPRDNEGVPMMTDRRFFLQANEFQVLGGQDIGVVVRRRLTVGLPDEGISPPTVAEAAHVISVPRERAFVSTSTARSSKNHVRTLDKNFATADYQTRDRGFPKVEELRWGSDGEIAWSL